MKPTTPAMKATAAPGNFWRVFSVPIALALISCVGLLSALLGDGVYDALSWVALAAPIAVIVWALRRR